MFSSVSFKRSLRAILGQLKCSPKLRICPQIFLSSDNGNLSGKFQSKLPSFTNRSHMCGELSQQHVKQRVTLCGWLQYHRFDGYFIILRDAFGLVQVVLANEELSKKLSDVPVESVIEVTGTVELRPDGKMNPEMKTGGIEVIAEELSVLGKCSATLPFHIHDFHKVKESLRLQYRYLDLRHSELQRNLRFRSELIFRMREFLCKHHGFVDVETPTLFRKTPGGAREFVVPTHSPGQFYTLPQSPQQFKQLLMVGGIDRYMQIAKCYRDETSKPDRQPEFTQVDLEMSFITQEGIMNLIEELLRYSLAGSEALPVPFPRIKYEDAIRCYGSDKPDTRFDLLLEDITDIFSECPFIPVAKAFETKPLSSIQAVKFQSAAVHLSNKDLEQLTDVFKKSFPDTKRPLFVLVKVNSDGGFHGNLDSRLGHVTCRRLSDRLKLEPGDIFALSAGLHLSACLAVGKIRTEMVNMLQNKLGKDVFELNGKMNFLWVEDFPLFLPKEDGSPGLESAHHPFTAPHPSSLDFVYTSPQKARSQHYDLVLNGNEIGGGSIRIHDSKLQRYVLEDVLKEKTDSLEHLMEALEFGCPPHGGIALGLDRLVALLCNAPTIREVIAFPKSSEGRCLMSKSPAPISEDVCEYYHLKRTISSGVKATEQTVAKETMQSAGGQEKL